jgi:hypothetical protein
LTTRRHLPSLPSSGDYVEIFDGTDGNAPKIGHVTGSMTDAFAPDGTVVQVSTPSPSADQRSSSAKQPNPALEM